MKYPVNLKSNKEESRPLSFTSEDGETVITCDYDYMGRRFMKKITIGGSITVHQRYLYRGYLQIAALDFTLSNLPALWFTHWDPTEASATRPLSIRKDETWYSYGHDLTKNVTELYKADGTIASTYDYSPYGAVTATGIDQPLQWSSEVYDTELGMVYYNYRHYNPRDGRWINRDPVAEQGGWNLYGFVGNNAIGYFDYLGGKVSDAVPEEYRPYLLGFFKEGKLPAIGSPTKQSIDALVAAIEKAEKEVLDKCQRPCYEIVLYRLASNIKGIKNLPWKGYNRAILIAHTTKGVKGDAPRKSFDVYSASSERGDQIRLANTEISNKVDIIGCHLEVDGIGQLQGLGMVVNKLKDLKPKDECKTPERIQIVSGTLSLASVCLMWILSFGLFLDAKLMPEVISKELEKMEEYEPKVFTFKLEDSFYDLAERYRGSSSCGDLNSRRHARFCLDEVQESLNYITLTMPNEWQGPLMLETDQKTFIFNNFRVVKARQSATSYEYGNKTYKRSELQALITDLVQDRFNFNDRVPICYNIGIGGNERLKDCWYFLAILHLFSNDRVMYYDPK